MASKKSKAALTAARTSVSDLPPVGAQFTVSETVELEEGRRLVARYLPALPGASPGDPKPTYRVTERNQAFVAEQIAAGAATLGGFGAGGAGNALAAGAGKASGTVRT